MRRRHRPAVSPEFVEQLRHFQGELEEVQRSRARARRRRHVRRLFARLGARRYLAGTLLILAAAAAIVLLTVF
jgi:glutathione S-transferase